MSNIVCQHCSAETPSEHNFCIGCDKQIRCLNSKCEKLLIKGKAFCFGCGQPLATISAPNSQPNKYVRDIKQSNDNYEEHVEFNISDHAVSELAPFIAGQMSFQPPRKTYSEQVNTFSPTPRSVESNSTTQLSPDVPKLPAAQAHPGVTHNTETDSAIDGAMRYFVRDGDLLIATGKDFKGKTWADQQRNFILLYASAYKKAFNHPIPSKDDFKISAEKAKVIDSSNFGRYLSETIREYFSELSNGFIIAPDGEKEVARIIALMEDDKAEAGYEYWSRVSSPSTKRTRLSKDDKNKLHSWVQEEVQLGSLDIRNLRKAHDYAIVSLWIIIIHLKKAQAIRWNDAYYYLKEKFKTISASPEAFSIAMRGDSIDLFSRQKWINWAFTG